MNKDDIYKDEYLFHDSIKERRKFCLPDVSGRGEEVIFEVNWNSMVKRKRQIKLSIGDSEAVIDRDQLWSILFILGNAEEQEKLASPFMKHTKVTKFMKMIGITANKDIKRGEMINVPLEFTYNPSDNQIIIGKGSLQKIRDAVQNN